ALLMTGCQPAAPSAAAAPAPTAPTQPAVARVMSHEDYRHFIGLVGTELRYRDFSPVFGTDWVEVQGGRRQHTRFGLRSLMQKCNMLPQDQWAQLVSERFDRLLDTVREQGAIVARMSDFDQARPNLVLRIYPAETVSGISRKQIINRVDLPGTVTVLMLDLPEALQSVSPDMA